MSIKFISFHEILARVEPRIEKQDTFWRKALEPGLKLAITLRYLATGNSYKSLQYGFRVAYNTISIIIIEVCEAISEEYSVEVMVCPFTPEPQLCQYKGRNILTESVLIMYTVV